MEQLMKVFSETIQFIDDITEVENTKFQAALKNNIAKVDDCMKQEQVLLLKLRGLDKKREAAQKALGYENLTFKQIIEKAPESDKKKLTEIFNSIEQKLKLYKKSFSNAQNAIELNLHRIDKKLESLNAADKFNKTYKEDGEVIMTKRSFTSRRV